MVQFKAVLCSALLASAGLVAATPYAQNVALEKLDSLIPRGIDPARIDAIRNRVGRPKGGFGPTRESKFPGGTRVSPASERNLPPLAAPPQIHPSKNSNSTQPQSADQDKSAPKPPSKEAAWREWSIDKA